MGEVGGDVGGELLDGEAVAQVLGGLEGVGEAQGGRETGERRGDE